MFGLVGTAVQTELVTMNGDRTVHGKIVVVIYIVSQKMALMQRTITLTQINQFWQFLAEMLLREYAIKR